jgi:hypothetical protein
MQNLDPIAAKWQGAIVTIITKGSPEPALRPAAFVFETPGGFAWVEPSYADPYGSSSPSFHQRAGTFEASDAGFVARVSDGEGVAVSRYEPNDAHLIGDALDWFADWLKAEGRTWQEERERVRELVRGNWGG